MLEILTTFRITWSLLCKSKEHAYFEIVGIDIKLKKLKIFWAHDTIFFANNYITVTEIGLSGGSTLWFSEKPELQTIINVM